MKDGSALREDSGRTWSGVVWLWPFCLLLSGCNHVPSQDLLGSFFPAWMLCAVGGGALSVAARVVLIKIGVDAFVPAKLLVYGGLAIAATFLSWFLWFGN